MLTCTPVMTGRHQEDKPSPFIAARPFVLPISKPEEENGTRTPKASMAMHQLKALAPLQLYAKNKEVGAESKEKEEDFKNDMDEMPYKGKEGKGLSQKCLPVTPGCEKRAPCGFTNMYLKQIAGAPIIPNTSPKKADFKMIDDIEIISSQPTTTSNTSNKQISGYNPFVNPFFNSKPEEPVPSAQPNELFKNFINNIK